MTIEIQIHRGAIAGKIPRSLISKAVEVIALDFGWSDAEISVAVVDDPEIHRVNKQFLQHDYPTDVISFDTTDSESLLEGEIVVSVDTARRIAEENGWSGEHELLLYIVHGMLHIVGLDDKAPADIEAMRRAERHYMELLVGDARVCAEAEESQTTPQPPANVPIKPATSAESVRNRRGTLPQSPKAGDSKGTE
jgi:probable rRNA maturation factor